MSAIDCRERLVHNDLLCVNVACTQYFISDGSCWRVVKGSIAYVAQEAWVQNATLRDNVLFGKPLNSSAYEKIIDACALRQDLEDFPGKDLTEIGEKVLFIMLLCYTLS